MTLHVLIADKFTRPLYYYITGEMKLDEQYFLYISEREATAPIPDRVHGLKRPLGKHIFYNAKLFFLLCKKADRIVMHGDTMIYFFALFPFFLRKTSWVIYGQELYSLQGRGDFFQTLKKFVLSKVKYHITHIKGDSELANKLLGSRARLVYSPMYLSNVVDTNNFMPSDVSQKKALKIMVGNSTDPTNQHKEAFDILLPYLADIETITCPLSYGRYDAYKHEIIALGKKMFGDKFVVMEQFMPFEEYKIFLSNIDIVIFNHSRQEAMGVTLTLLSLGKIVYMNQNTTSYESLKSRGFAVFDNRSIAQEGLRTNREVSENISQLNEFYSKKVFDDSWIQINQL